MKTCKTSNKAKLYAISVSVEANIKLLEQAINGNNKEAQKLFISELKKDRERLLQTILND